MKKGILILIISMIVFNCKSDKKENNQEIKQQVDNLNSEKEINDSAYERNLLDLRKVNVQFNNDYKVEKFGLEKINDSIFQFVLKLNDSTTNEMVKSLSVGVRAYNEFMPKGKVMSAHAPEIDVIDGNKYIRLRAVLNNIKYFDSLDLYSYQRKNWKASGRLGGFIIRDILVKN